MSNRSMPVNAKSRAATNTLLAELRGGRWRPTAWRWFLGAAAARSTRDAVAHPRAVAELTLLHGGILASGRGHGRTWTATSWLLCLTHLGMLGDRTSIGPATGLTLVRANLPAAAAGWGRWLAPLAVLLDITDGRLARRLGAETMFGAYADSLADAAFWTWYAAKHEPSRSIRAAAIVMSAGPSVAVAVTGIARGRMVETPRPVILRPAAALQVALAARAVCRTGWAGRERPPSDW